ncbi:MAG: hypothetical protein EAZ89_19100 [Bacteroidetes bacterium]|nr:MAG: hypothetical protein EAZ89_19100 [Bacteroidota bacterium]
MLAACDKYPEGPELSPWPPSFRVVNTWKWAYALENGKNITADLQTTTIEFTEDQICRICKGDSCSEGTWNFVNKKEKLQLIFDNEARAYDIQMLRKVEIWLQYTDPDSSFSVQWELKPVE